MKTNDTIKVHLYDTSNREIKTRNYGKIFPVYEKTENLALIGIQRSCLTVATVKYLRHLKHLRHL